MPERKEAARTSELLELVDAEWLRLLSAVERETAMEAAGSPPSDGWSSRDVLSHVRLYDAWLLGVLDPARREEQLPYRSYLTPEADIHERNRRHVEADRTLSEEEVRRRALDTHALLREALAEVQDGRLAARHTATGSSFEPSPDGRSLAALLAIETHWHYADHTEDLEGRHREAPA
jgi:Mycothiol maleylpyruvate isomerase N-terminal domain